MCDHTWRGWFLAQSELSKGIFCLIVLSRDMMKLEAVKFLL
jgi:hypothetical protein